jgi:hypothetical protein
MTDFEVVLENIKLKEDLGIEQLIIANCTIDLFSVIAYRESYTEDGELEPYTIVVLPYGVAYCLNIPYEEFKILHNREVRGIK